MVGHAPCVRSHRAVYLVEGDAREVGGAGAGSGQHARVLRDHGARGAGAALGGGAGAAAVPGRVARGSRVGAPQAAARAIRGRRAARGGRARLRAAAAVRRPPQGAPPLAQHQARSAPAFGDRQPDDAAGFTLQPPIRCTTDR